MTLTPNRDAVNAAAAERRRRCAVEIARDDAPGIGRRMAIEVNEAVQGGAADMLDRAIDEDAIWPQVGGALAAGLGSFLLTVAAGDPAQAEALLPEALASIAELALQQINRRPEQLVVRHADASPAGRA